ncbi:MAG: hypothetical protein NZM04_06235 [Methylacidiphilales bacterium]|nr:hypothetical protein [Candidatus Methylacidiphilales bacterium]
MLSIPFTPPVPLWLSNGDPANYSPDFIVPTTDSTVWLVETKSRAELDLQQKIHGPAPAIVHRRHYCRVQRRQHPGPTLRLRIRRPDQLRAAPTKDIRGASPYFHRVSFATKRVEENPL